MTPEFVNLYIEKILTEVTELTKTNLLLKTHLAHNDLVIAQLNKKLEEAEKLSAKKAKKSETVEQTF
jgi:hypothetical protein